ncbi:MAG: hypothetical protein P8J45_04855 [Phycisphaerales bacterium]|nr:hypothetical protein [Phycisphaerales bacterium]
MHNQCIPLVLGGLGFLLGAGLLMADDRPLPPTGFDRGEQGEHHAMPMGSWVCGDLPTEITWEVFDPTPRPLEVNYNARFMNCLDLGEDGIIDLDGDGIFEQLQEDDAGVEFYGETGEGSSFPLLVLRHREGGLAIESVLLFDEGSAFWSDLIGMDPTELQYVQQSFYFDVDADSMIDAVISIGWNDMNKGTWERRLFWYRNQLTPPTRSGDSDLNDDGRVDGEDLLQLLSDWSG